MSRSRARPQGRQGARLGRAQAALAAAVGPWPQNEHRGSGLLSFVSVVLGMFERTQIITPVPTGDTRPVPTTDPAPTSWGRACCGSDRNPTASRVVALDDRRYGGANDQTATLRRSTPHRVPTAHHRCVPGTARRRLVHAGAAAEKEQVAPNLLPQSRRDIDSI